MPIIGEKMKGMKIALALSAFFVVLGMVGSLVSAQSMTTDSFVGHRVQSGIYMYGDEGLFMGVGFILYGIISPLIGYCWQYGHTWRLRKTAMRTL